MHIEKPRRKILLDLSVKNGFLKHIYTYIYSRHKVNTANINNYLTKWEVHSILFYHFFNFFWGV